MKLTQIYSLSRYPLYKQASPTKVQQQNSKLMIFLCTFGPNYSRKSQNQLGKMSCSCQAHKSSILNETSSCCQMLVCCVQCEWVNHPAAAYRDGKEALVGKSHLCLLILITMWPGYITLGVSLSQLPADLHTKVTATLYTCTQKCGSQ